MHMPASTFLIYIRGVCFSYSNITLFWVIVKWNGNKKAPLSWPFLGAFYLNQSKYVYQLFLV